MKLRIFYILKYLTYITSSYIPNIVFSFLLLYFHSYYCIFILTIVFLFLLLYFHYKYFIFRPEREVDLESVFSSKSEIGVPLLIPSSFTVDNVVSVLYAGKTVKGSGNIHYT